ncbi:MAG: glycogen synthase GlgA [Candidatus Eisenbacteria bacterium]|nr:glycogen synthase GlgA [Candidatus Eisenbacteria bacterium]
MRIAIAAAEMVPFVKVGGLADVIGALPRELARLGHRVSVFLPRPPVLPTDRLPALSLSSLGSIDVPMGTGTMRAEVERARIGVPGMEVLLIQNRDLFDRPDPYVDPATGQDWPDNARRFVFFSRAVLEAMRSIGMVPEVVHCNDYQTGLVPFLMREDRSRYEALQRTGTLFAIHNMGYQGIFPPEVLAELGVGYREKFFYTMGPLEYFGKVNFMKAAILYADLISAVSERYAHEIQQPEYGFGLEGVLALRGDDVIGILNGIDVEEWNPETDPLIPANYSASDLGPKRENKRRLLQAMELPEGRSVPVIGMISRLVDQKGLDLIEESAKDLMQRDLALVVLGNGLPKYEKLLRDLARKHPHKVAVSLTFNNPLAHLIEAGSDMFLMPSRYEPCGLNQMYSLRYGTIPIVRATGGLADTVQEYDPDTGRGNGFVFTEYTSRAMLHAIDRALAAYARDRAWKKLLSQVMRIDFSWGRAAQKYVGAYQRAIESRL